MLSCLIYIYIYIILWLIFQVCELDIIFNFEKAYFMLDELMLGGEVQETSKKNVLKAIAAQDLLQEVRTPQKLSKFYSFFFFFLSHPMHTYTKTFLSVYWHLYHCTLHLELFGLPMRINNLLLVLIIVWEISMGRKSSFIWH